MLVCKTVGRGDCFFFKYYSPETPRANTLGEAALVASEGLAAYAVGQSPATSS